MTSATSSPAPPTDPAGGLYAPPALLHAAEELYAGTLADERTWIWSERIFTQGARAVALYIELGAPARAAATIIPPRFEWYVEQNPAERAGWYYETREELAPDGRMVHRHRVHTLGEDLEAHATDPADELVYRAFVRMAVWARNVRVVFRGWVGQGGRVRLTATAEP